MNRKLSIKPVTIAHLDQYDELMRYVFQVTNKNIKESGYEEGELTRSKRPILERSDVLGWFNEDDELVSSISVYPCRVNIHGTIYDMGGVTGVGTYPEYANGGLMNDLIALALKHMKNNRQYVSYLYPYSIPYYRRKGWEIMSDKISFTLKDTQIPRHTNVSGYVERLDVTDQAVLEVYDKYARAMHGAMIRGEHDWAEYWRWENEDERTAAIYFDENNNPEGCLFYWIEDDIFYIKELIYISQDAYHGLWSFIRAHYSMIDEVKGSIYTNDPLSFLLEDSQISETIEPYFMARIVDAERFLEIYPYDDEIMPFHFKVSDPLAEWNNRIFGIIKNKRGNGVEITDKAVGKCVKLDIQTLSTLMMSYKSPAYLHKIGRLKTDQTTLRLIEKLIPAETPYFSDYF